MISENKTPNCVVRMPTTSAHQHRLQFFEPTRRPTFRTRYFEFETGDGTASATIKGKLGQGHSDILSAIFFHSVFRREEKEGSNKGGLILLVDMHKIRTTAGRQLRTRSYNKEKLDTRVSSDHVKNIVEDLKTVLITSQIPYRDIATVNHGIFNEFFESKIKVSEIEGPRPHVERKRLFIDSEDLDDRGESRDRYLPPVSDYLSCNFLN
ncbi:hypothetical protein AAKU67_004318 [Oxalobacteraceae bacterium GrIS 2.11]